MYDFGGHAGISAAYIVTNGVKVFLVKVLAVVVESQALYFILEIGNW